ncbi:MAG: acylphosphatase [Thermoleophilaceae bacterium]
MIRKRVIARGNVQGVFFRDATRREAARAGVAGWASNRSDGAVEVVFEGDDEAVQRMVDFVRAGPGHSDVADVEVGDEEPEGLDGFEVR